MTLGRPVDASRPEIPEPTHARLPLDSRCELGALLIV